MIRLIGKAMMAVKIWSNFKIQLLTVLMLALLAVAIFYKQNKHLILMEYSSLGIGFTVDTIHGNIAGAGVYLPKNDNAIRREMSKVGSNDLVPGVGAFGVKIGDSVSVFKRLMNVKRHGKFTVTDEARPYMLYGYDFTDGRRMDITVEDGKVKSIIILGPFRTPEGLTERANASEIRYVYGSPD